MMDTIQFQLFLATFSAWVNRQQAGVIANLIEENRVEERYEQTHGPLRSVVSEVVGKFLDCGLLEHGFARVRCAACRAEFLVAFRCYLELKTIWSFSRGARQKTCSPVSLACPSSSLPITATRRTCNGDLPNSIAWSSATVVLRAQDSHALPYAPPRYHESG